MTAAATDLIDGYLARRWKQVTTVGTLLDPIADKLLISAALISLVEIQRVPAWMVILIIGREFAVTGLRSIAASSGYTIRASDLGKTKMVTQVAAIALVIGGIRWPQLAEYGQFAMWAVVIFGFVSAAAYFGKFWRKVDEGVKLRRRRELLRFERQKKRARSGDGPQRRIGRAVTAARSLSPALAGQVIEQGRIERFHEVGGGCLGLRFVLIHHRNDHPHQRRIGAIQANRVRHHPELGLVFVGDHPVARLVPIQHQVLLASGSDHVSIHGNRGGSGRRRSEISPEESGTHPEPGRQFLGEWGALPLRWVRKPATNRLAASTPGLRAIRGVGIAVRHDSEYRPP